MVEILNHQQIDIEVSLPDGRVLRGPRGSSLEEFLSALPEWNEREIVGGIVNGELRELLYQLGMESKVRLVKMDDKDGALIYRRSLTFLLEAAFEELFPTAGLTVDHSVSSGGYFCRVTGRSPLTEMEIKQLEDHMKELVRLNIKIRKSQIPIEEAIALFKQKGFPEKVRLLGYRKKSHLVIYTLGQHQDYHHGYMLPSTKFLHTFAVESSPGGFILRFPRRSSSSEIQALPPQTQKLLETFKLYSDWLGRLGIDNVAALNDDIVDGRIREVILVSEALHEQRIADIARRIAENQDKIKIILIAGPSSSGKTTSSKRLTVQLLSQGISPYPIELDNYFVDREKTPRDEQGQYDFESLHALDIDRLNDDLQALIRGEEVQLPRYDFLSGKSVDGEVVKLEKSQLLIMEGIHGLNPNLLPQLPVEHTFRIYASCLTQLNLDRYNRISTTDTRLLRRIVRDARERGYSAQDTIQRWDSVGRGEKQHIFPYQEFADEMLNTALVYELSALKPFVEPLLRQVPYNSYEHIEAKRLLAMLEWFQPLDTELIPDNSILREFIGGSILRDFRSRKNRD